MLHATPNQLTEIYSHFYTNKNIFPHIRKDYLQRKITANHVIYDQGVIIIYNRYKRNTHLGNVIATKGSIILHQILNPSHNNNNNNNSTVSPSNTQEQIQKFFLMVESDVYLTVRESNARAIAFYTKVGFQKAGEVLWMNGKLPGVVFKYTAPCIALP